MSLNIKIVLMVLAAFSLWVEKPARAQVPPRHHVQVTLVSGLETVSPGGKVTVGLRERIEPGWHTYWANPGDSGEPTQIEWALPQGYRAGDLQWPVPRTIEIGPLANYGYQDEVTLLSEVEVPREAALGQTTLKGKVRLLVCKEICIPEETDVSLPLTIADRDTASAGKGEIERVRAKLPSTLPDGVAQYAKSSPTTLTLKITLPEPQLDAVAHARFYPLTQDVISNPAAQPLTKAGDALFLTLTRAGDEALPAGMSGLLVLEGNAGAPKAAFLLSASLSQKSLSLIGGGSPTLGEGPTSFSTGVFFASILFAFVGGVILNFMPCVLPVLALKALSFASGPPRAHQEQGVAYALGVLASFLTLAAVIGVLRSGSTYLGWGFQFQSPVFVLLLAVLFFALGLSLSGVFSFGGGLVAVGDRWTRKPGLAGYFFTGVLATLAATPCTAPFMGSAIGFAITQSFPVLVCVMAALGAGFAAPFALLSFSPGLQRYLPKAGAWMETLKQVLAFPLYITAAWLVWVLSLEAQSDGVFAAGIALVGVAFAAYLAGKTALSPLKVKLLAPAVAALALFSASATLLGMEEAAKNGTPLKPGLLAEEPFSQKKLAALQEEGRPVFVNLTAAWCITCKVNERIALTADGIADAFKRQGIVYLKGDWTRGNPDITEYLQRFGRAGVPLYVYYPRGGGSPKVLPQLLTETLILNEIDPEKEGANLRSSKGT